MGGRGPPRSVRRGPGDRANAARRRRSNRYPDPADGPMRDSRSARRDGARGPGPRHGPPRDRHARGDGLVVYGACFGTRTNETLALAVAGLLTARLGARVEVAAVEPTWFVLELPIAVDCRGARRRLPRSTLPRSARWWNGSSRAASTTAGSSSTVARKLGVILSASADPRDLRTLEPLLEQSRATTPLGRGGAREDAARPLRPGRTPSRSWSVSGPGRSRSSRALPPPSRTGRSSGCAGGRSRTSRPPRS